MELIRDVLDKQLIDNKQRKIGKVDGIIMTLDDNGPPRITFIEMGAVTLARRLHPRLGDSVAKLLRRYGLTNGEPYRIPWSKTVVTGIDVSVAIDAQKTPALAWETWLRNKIVGRIQGA
jgi:hypothetical protein